MLTAAATTADDYRQMKSKKDAQRTQRALEVPPRIAIQGGTSSVRRHLHEAKALSRWRAA